MGAPQTGPGLEFTSLAEVGDTIAHRRAVYELNKTCSADIPERGECYAFSEMTGVLSSHRGRGVSTALKPMAIDFARTSGLRTPADQAADWPSRPLCTLCACS